MKKLVNELIPNVDTGELDFRQATVTQVTPTVQVQLGGSTTAIDVRFFTTYYPVVGDVVWVIQVRTDFIIVGPIYSSLPTYTTVTSFLNGWVPNGGTAPPPAYKKLGNFVFLRGWMKNGVMNQNAFTLPVGFRPPYLLHVTCNSFGVLGVLSIDTTGNVAPVAGGNATIEMDSCFFDIT
jgi:hypothetical protein